MRIKIKRLDKALPLPEYKTTGAVAFDLAARETITIGPKELALIPTGLVVQTPPGHMLSIFARSSIAKKKGLMLANSVGVIDQDYCGPEDEIKISVYNFTDAPTTVEQWERIAQGVFVKIEKAEWEETEEIITPTRGGFGSTGK